MEPLFLADFLFNMVQGYFFGYRCPIWLLSSYQGYWWDQLGLIRHLWLTKRWKINQVPSILVVEWGFDKICCVYYLLHKTYFRPMHLYPTTLTVSTVPSDTTIDLIIPWICWNPYSTASKRSVLDIRSFGYLQEEKVHCLCICLLVNKWSYTTNALLDHSEVSKESHFGPEIVKIEQ